MSEPGTSTSKTTTSDDLAESLVPAVEVRTALIPVDKLAEFLEQVRGTPLPGWTGRIGDEPGCEPPVDETMRCVRTKIKAPRPELPTGNVEVELTYEEVEPPAKSDWVKKYLGDLFRSA